MPPTEPNKSGNGTAPPAIFKATSINQVCNSLYIGSRPIHDLHHLVTSYDIKKIVTVQTDPLILDRDDVECLHISESDLPISDLLSHFDRAFEFIHEGVTNRKNVYVHCLMGISRSATIVIAYLMKSCKWSANEAYDHLKLERPKVWPNYGFRIQLNLYERMNCVVDRSSVNFKAYLVAYDPEWEEVEEGDIQTYEIEIDPQKIVCFWPNMDFGDYQYLCDTYPANMVIDGEEYGSVEYYYERKQRDGLMAVVEAAMSPTAPKVSANSVSAPVAPHVLTLPPKQLIHAWDMKEGIQFWKHAIECKFEQNEDLRKKLIDIDKDCLIVNSCDDAVFGAGMRHGQVIEWAKKHKGRKLKIPMFLTAETEKHFPKVGNGTNLIGALLMRTRDKLINAHYNQGDPEMYSDPQVMAVAHRLVEDVYKKKEDFFF